MKRQSVFGKALVLMMLFLLISSVAAVRAQDDDDNDDDFEDDHDDDDDEEHEPEYERDEDGTVWIQTDIMTVRLDNEHPSYQYWYTADDNGSLARFRVSYLMVVEFEDNNGDGVYQVNETLSFAPLDAFEWTLQTGSVTNDLGQNTEVYASYTKGGLSDEDFDDDWFKDWMPGYGDDEEDEEDENPTLADENDDDDASDDTELNLTQYEEMTLQFYGHIYLNDYNGTVSDDEGVKANYTIDGGVELKVDIEIGNFPFTSETSMITVLNYLQEDLASSDDNHHFRLHEDDDDEDHESEDEWEDDELGEKFEDKDDDDDGEDDEVQELSLVQGSTNVTRGFYRWLDTAVMTLTNGSQFAVDVSASYWTDGNALLLFLAYPNFNGGSLLHDPSMKLLETASPIDPPVWNPDIPLETLAGVGIGVIVIAGIIVAIKRR